jgi:vacuolar iron transporter family protein
MVDGGSTAVRGSWWSRAVAWIAHRWDAATIRSWTMDANDGIIATAGVLQGFSGAGASAHTLIVAVTVATVAGAFSVGGAKWSEESGERDAQLEIIARERAELETDPDDEIADLARYYEGKGLTPDVAQQVAQQLSARDALAAQLESEHGIVSVLTRWDTLRAGIGSAISYVVGALVPLLVTVFTPIDVGTGLIIGAVLLSLGITSIVAARGGRTPLWRALLRTLVVGAATMGISYLVGELLF